MHVQKITLNGLMTAVVFSILVYMITAPIRHSIDDKLNEEN